MVRWAQICPVIQHLSSIQAHNWRHARRAVAGASCGLDEVPGLLELLREACAPSHPWGDSHPPLVLSGHAASLTLPRNSPARMITKFLLRLTFFHSVIPSGLIATTWSSFCNRNSTGILLDPFVTLCLCHVPSITRHGFNLVTSASDPSVTPVTCRQARRQ